MTSPRVMRAMASPTISHFDQLLLGALELALATQGYRRAPV